MKITVLGSGTSHGIPVVGCSCPVCTSDDERDKRTRSSVYIEGRGGERALIDAGPEFRLQAVAAGINRLDGIFLTHAHADHIHGLDDVRSLCRNAPIPVYGNALTIAEMKERFSYIWRDTQLGGGKPKLTPVVVSGPVQIGDLTFTPAPVKHGILDILGWEVCECIRLESIPGESVRSEEPGRSFLYLTDTSAIPPSTHKQLVEKDISRIIIIGGLRMRPHETHFTFQEALNAALSLNAEKVYLTHICHSHSHAEIEEYCRNFMGNLDTSTQNVKKAELHPAYDRLELYI